MVCTTNVFANRGPRAGGDARPYNPIGTGAKYAAERIRIVTNDMIRGGYRYTCVFRRPTEGASGTPPLTEWFLTFPDRLHPRSSIRPRYEKD